MKAKKCTSKALWPHALFENNWMLDKKKLLLLHAHVEFIPSDERKLLNLFDSAYRRMCFSSLLGKRMRKTDESSDGEEFTLRSCSPAHIKCLHLQQIEAADKVKFSSGESRKVHQTPVLTFAYVESFFLILSWHEVNKCRKF